MNVGVLNTSSSLAAAVISSQASAEGYEVVIPRAIYAKEIHRVRSLPQVLGWRYHPKSHGTKPCGCPYCQSRGTIKSRKIRKAYED